jgi:hypothetical protein
MNDRDDLINKISKFFNKYDIHVKKEFGSWEKAIMIIENKNIRKELKRNLNEIYKKTGKCTYEYYKKMKYKPSYSIIRKEFGSWENALKELNIPNSKTTYSEDEIVKSLQEFYKEFGIISEGMYIKSKRKPSVKAIYSKFNNWNNALKQAGIDIQYHKKDNITDQDIIEALHLAKTEISNQKLTRSYYSQWAKNNNKPSESTIIKRFGSWREALIKAKIKN